MFKLKRELGSLERAFLVADQHAPFHIVSVLRLEGAPSPNVLKQSLQILQNRHSFLKARLIHEKGSYYLATLVEPSLPFYFLPRWNADHWLYIAEVELAKGLLASGGPLFRCTYLYSEVDERGDLILSFYHPIADMSSVNHLLHELLVVCASFVDQKTVSLYELPPVSPAEDRFPPAFRGVQLVTHQLGYAYRQMIDDIYYRIQTRGKRTPALNNQLSRGRVLPVQFSEGVTGSLLQRARKEGVTLNSVLNAAMLLALNRHLYTGQQVPMRTLSFVSLRPYVWPPLNDEDLACYISPLRYTNIVSGGMDFWSLVHNLHKKFDVTLKTADKFTAATFAESHVRKLTVSRSCRIAATSLTYSGVVPVQTVYGRMRVMGLHTFLSAYDLGPEIVAQAEIFNNQLFWDFTYLEADMTRQEANAIVEEIKSILNSALSTTTLAASEK